MTDSTITTIAKASQEMGKSSSFDVTSIFVVISLVLFVGILISIIYKIIVNQFKTVNENISLIKSQIQETLKNSQILCAEKNKNTKSIVDDSINFINSSIENLFNTIVELMGEGYTCPTPLALSIFSEMMELHCLKKASKLYERVRSANGSTTQIINLLSHDFREITEKEKEILDKIKYTNAHRLGEELDHILRKENWDNFINTNVSFLVNKFIGKNPTWTDVREDTMAMFMDLINPMKENIRVKGGIL